MRRRTLIIGGTGALVLGAAGLGTWWRFGYSLPPDLKQRLRVLGVKEFAVFEAVASRVLHSDDAGWPKANTLHVGLFADRYLARLPRREQRDVVRLLNFVEHGAPIMARRFSRFTQLPPEAQDAVLHALNTHRFSLVRGGFDALKSLCALSYFRAPETWPLCGYDGPLVGRPL